MSERFAVSARRGTAGYRRCEERLINNFVAPVVEAPRSDRLRFPCPPGSSVTGSPTAVSVPSEAEVLAGLRDGNWLPTDEVRGPAMSSGGQSRRIPRFAEAAANEPGRESNEDETHLDMNPLIDVCLVLLIFFILTITYASLERAIDVPQLNPDQKGPSQVEYKDIKDQVFLVTAKMDGDKAIVRVAQKETPIDQLAAR